MNKKRKRMSLRCGFTVLELIIVITISTIIAGALVPFFMSKKADVSLDKLLVDFTNIETAFNMYMYEHGKVLPGISSMPLNDFTPLRGYLAPSDTGVFLYFMECDTDFYQFYVYTKSETHDNWLASFCSQWQSGPTRVWEVHQEHPWGNKLYSLLSSKGENVQWGS